MLLYYCSLVISRGMQAKMLLSTPFTVTFIPDCL